MDTLGIIRQLEEDSALRAQLRAVLLGDEMLELPALVRELAARVDQLAAAQTELAAAMARTQQSLAELSDSVRRGFERTDRDIAELKGFGLEARFTRNPRRYIPRSFATGVQVLVDERLEAFLEALDPADGTEIGRTDAIAEAQLGGDGEVILVVEVAWTAHADDIERAFRRAQLLASRGRAARGLVVSHVDPSEGVLAAAVQVGVAVVSESKGLLTPGTPSAA
ncbi:MAG: hypothetical protein ACRDYY_17500 [Acidimicrobiales bacterium]